MKKKNIEFYIIVQGELVKIKGVKTFTLQGEKFIIHNTEQGKNKRFWRVSHFNTGLGTGDIESTQDKVQSEFEAEIKKYKTNIKNAVKEKIQVNNKKKLFPCLNCKEFKISQDVRVSLCGYSKKQPHKRKLTCKQFNERKKESEKN